MVTPKRDKNNQGLSWAKALEGIPHSGTVETVPPGWKTTLQIAKELGTSRQTATSHISYLVSEGRAEYKKFRIQTPARVLPVPHYRLL